MKTLVFEKKEAVRLRKKGLSYRDILRKVPVSKSTISTWLRNAQLTDAEKSIMKRRRENNISKGRIRAAAALHSLRVERDEVLRKAAICDFVIYKLDPFFYVGMALYWAEGSKRSDSFTFVNSDSDMMFVMLNWMGRFLNVRREDVRARLYLHKPYANENLERYWSHATRIPIQNFRRTIYKPTGLLIKKRPNYKGCLRIEIGGVSHLRRYLYWQKMMLEDYRKQS